MSGGTVGSDHTGNCTDHQRIDIINPSNFREEPADEFSLEPPRNPTDCSNKDRGSPQKTPHYFHHVPLCRAVSIISMSCYLHQHSTTILHSHTICNLDVIVIDNIVRTLTNHSSFVFYNVLYC